MPILFKETNSSLVISVKKDNPDSIEEIQEAINKYPDERVALNSLMDQAGYIGNDWYCLFNVGLTEAPVVAYGATQYDEDGYPIDFESIYYYGNYMLENCLEYLIENRSVEFKKLEKD
jgi:hypothetical protein